MNLLIIGGTVFLGRHLTAAALARGHRVTHFNRGKSAPGGMLGVEQITGNRDGGLEPLVGRRWDAVIDTCGYVPRIVEQSARLLADAVDHYTFVSSISVYPAFPEPGLDESGAVGTLDDPTVEEVTGETYGPLKALCEQQVEAALPGRALIVRPGLIVGPDDPSDRFTYWPLRLERGGEVLAPGSPDRRIQFIDVRDLADWTVGMADERRTGVFNATGPADTLTMGELLEACRTAVESAADVTWVDEQFLLDRGVAPWTELPLWVPSSDPAMRCIEQVSVRKAVESGMTFRPVADTVRDTLAWAAREATDREPRAGMKPNREAELLRAWGDQRLPAGTTS